MLLGIGETTIIQVLIVQAPFQCKPRASLPFHEISIPYFSTFSKCLPVNYSIVRKDPAGIVVPFQEKVSKLLHSYKLEMLINNQTNLVIWVPLLHNLKQYDNLKDFPLQIGRLTLILFQLNRSRLKRYISQNVSFYRSDIKIQKYCIIIVCFSLCKNDKFML